MSGCGGYYSQLDFLEEKISFDIKHQNALETTWLHFSTENFTNDSGTYAFRKKSIAIGDGKEKWVFQNSKGCQIVYITKLDKFDVRRVINAYILSARELCDKKIKYSSQLM